MGEGGWNKQIPPWQRMWKERERLSSSAWDEDGETEEADKVCNAGRSRADLTVLQLGYKVCVCTACAGVVFCN